MAVRRMRAWARVDPTSNAAIVEGQMSDLELDKSADGQVFEVSVGTVVTLTLPENPTTGFRWHAEPEPAGVLAAQEGTFAPRRTGVGGGGARTIRFRVEQGGRAELHAWLWRDWEGEASIIETFTSTLIATG